MRLRKIEAFLLTLIILTGLAQLYAIAFTAAAATIDSVSLMSKINTERSNRNIPILATDQRLVSAASGKTADMIARDYFDHRDPDGNYVWPLITSAGYYPYKTLGENLAIDFATEDGIVKAWLNSPSHRENLLNSAFADQGLSAQYGDFEQRYTSVVTSLFGTLLVVQPPQQPQTYPEPDTAPVQQPTVQPAQTPESPKITQEEEAPTTPAAGSSNPAIQLTEKPVTEDTAASAKEFIQTVPQATDRSDQNVFGTIRNVFSVLISLLAITVIVDILRHGTKNHLWPGGDQTPLIMVILLAVLLSMQF